MGGSIHAAGILAFVAATVLVLCVFRQGPRADGERWRGLWLAIRALLVETLIGFVASLHMCGAGNPIAQWLIPGVGWAFVSLVVPSRRVRKLFGRGALLLSLLLCYQYLDLVHSADYTGNPAWERRSMRDSDVRVSTLWHTRLTGLYAKQVVPAEKTFPVH